MVEAEREAFRAEMAGALTKLNEALASRVGFDKTEQVSEYIEHHEFGLALDLILFLIVKHGLDAQVFEADANGLAQRMGMQDSPDVIEWRKYSSRA